MPRAFIVYSSSPHVSYINDVLEVIDSVLRSMDIDPFYLRDQIRGGRLYPPELQEMITQSDMGIVILDGLRPNVTFEYGLLIMRNIDVIPLKKSDAKYSIKSLFYNPAVSNLDPSFAFGDFRYKEAALKNLKDPLLDINIHFSDCQGTHIVEYNTIDDTNELNSLGNQLRVEIENIIPRLRSRHGPGFIDLRLLFADLNLDLLDESVRLLSLFSFLGWRQEFEGDLRFQSIREGFLSLFQNEQATISVINDIFEELLDSDQPILRNYGRYLTVDSDRLISESFEYLLNNGNIFNNLFLSIMRSDVVELKTRFIERVSTSGILEIQMVRSIGNHIISRSGLFQDISVLQDRENSRLFSRVASIYPLGALDKLDSWINPLSPMQIGDLFPFQSTIFSPGNPHDEVLWFLSRVAKLDSYYVRAMNILFKFSIPVVVNQAQIHAHIHSAVHKLPLDRFLEHCHSLLGEVNVRTRWNFIQNISWAEDWSEEYLNASKELKFRAILTFLERSWSISGPVMDGAIRISHFRVPDGLDYDALEICRTEAYRILMVWLDQPGEYTNIYDSLFDYFYRNLSEWVKYIPWDEIKSLYERVFLDNSQKMLRFLRHIDLLRVFTNEVWQGRYSEEHLLQIFQFQEELEGRLTTPDYYRRKMSFSVYDTSIVKMFPEQPERENYINTLQTELINKYIGLDESEMREISKLLLIENFDQSYQFGMKLKDLLIEEQIKAKIEFGSEIIDRNTIENISEFYLGLWNALFSTNEEEWENLLEHYWNNSFIQPYLDKILWRTDRYFNEFRWNKFKGLFESRQIEPIKLIDAIQHKELPSSISIDDKRLLLIESIRYIGEMVESEVQYPKDAYFSFIWRLEHLISEDEDLLNEDLAESFLDSFQPIGDVILSQLPNTDIIIKFGQLSEVSFKKWLKAGFQVSRQVGEDFLIKCADIFIDLIFQITEQLFTFPQDGEELSEDHRISYTFKVSGNPKILLKFTSQQIDRLYELNSSMLGSLFGRLIRNSRIDDDFPAVLRRLIIQHHEDVDFKNRIFHEFSIGLRFFGGNDYDQQFAGDYKRIIKWRESATNNIFREWLQEFHQYIDSLRNQNREFWREREVE